MHEHRRDQIVLRLKKAVGHAQAVLRMVEDNRDCPEILLQISAVRAALTQAGKLVLQDHLDTCIVDAIKNGSGEKALSEFKDSLSRFLT